MFSTGRISASKTALCRRLLAAGIGGVLSLAAIGASSARADDLASTSYRVTVKPAAERPTILGLVCGARQSIRATLHDLAELDGDDAAVPERGSVVDALAHKARSGVQVELLVDRGQASEALVGALTAAGVRVLERGSFSAHAGEESFVVDDQNLLVMSLRRLPSIARAREYGVQTNEPATVAEAVRGFTAAFSSKLPPARWPEAPATMEVRGPSRSVPDNHG